MREIFLTDEQYDFLIDLSNRLHTQDNRATSDPIFCIYQLERFYTEDGNHTQYICDGEEIDEDFVKASIAQYRKDHPELNLCDESVIEELGYRIARYDFKEVPVSGQCYFSEKAAQEHIDSNHYHYNKPFVYAESAWRNYEWQKIRGIILSLTKEEKPFQHK